MKKIKQIGNKFLAVLLTAAMVFALSPLPAEAAVSNNSMPEVYVYERSLKWSTSHSLFADCATAP